MGFVLGCAHVSSFHSRDGFRFGLGLTRKPVLNRRVGQYAFDERCAEGGIVPPDPRSLAQAPPRISSFCVCVRVPFVYEPPMQFYLASHLEGVQPLLCVGQRSFSGV